MGPLGQGRLDGMEWADLRNMGEQRGGLCDVTQF